MKKPAASEGGFALIIVLALVVLIVSVVVAFLLSTTTERRAASGFASLVSARQFGDTAVSLVEAQINHATTYVPSSTATVAWTSQPGLLRTFDQTGGVLSFYKLYSADKMITGSAGDLDADTPSADWVKNPAMWVDLNARASAGVNPATKADNYVYPILDPRAANAAAIDGMTSLKGNGTAASNKGLYIDSSAPALQNFPAQAEADVAAPMPVRWLYILQDGKAVAPSGGSGATSVKFDEFPTTDPTTGRSQPNPVVGRIAFWTDDDTSKVNVNTASEGNFWDAPHGYSRQEVYDFAVKQPARGEYQRYPGHPATVSLSSIFPALTTEQIYSIIPRVTGESDNVNGAGWTSAGGTQIPKAVSGITNPSQGVRSDGERLFTSVDELMFKGTRYSGDPTKRVAVTDTTTNPNPVSVLTRKVIDSRRFFLTAQSRAPETNLFNLPRIATWPVYQLSGSGEVDNLRTNPFDRLIALCSSTGLTTNGSGPTSFQKPYFFQRRNAYSATDDLGDPEATPPLSGGIQRNLDLYNYLRYVTGTPIPGFGGDFKTKYGDDRDQILTEMFDYIRCTNLYDDLLDYDANGQALALTSRGQYTFTKNIYASGGQLGTAGSGCITPIRGPANTMGEGRADTLRELDVMFIACADGNDAASNNPDTNAMLMEPFPVGNAAKKGTKLTATERRVQAIVLPEFYSTMVGWRLRHPDVTIQIEGLDGMTLNGKSLNFPAKAYVSAGFDPQAMGGGTGAGGSLPLIWAPFRKLTYRPTTTAPIASGSSNYPFVSFPVTVSNTGPMRFASLYPIKVSLFTPSTSTPDTARPVQTLTLNFPVTDAPLPKISKVPRRWTFFSDGVDPANGPTDNVPAKWGRLRLDNKTEQPGSHISNNGIDLIMDGSSASKELDGSNAIDVVRAMLPSHSDYRLVAATNDVLGPVYQKHPWYDDTSRYLAMLYSSNDPGGTLVSGAGQRIPDIPSARTGVADATGDFDRGVAVRASGAGVNKPDEGDLRRESSDKPTLKDLVAGEGKTIPYYASYNNQAVQGATYFSPNRVIPSPVMFGSLPTGVKSGVPWQTLLFRPASVDETTHIGLRSPPDHLLLDLFWMPVVDPYAISDRFSTAGKINLNYKIHPFNYIERTAALRAALSSEKMARITTGDTNLSPNIYSGGFDAPSQADYRSSIDADQMFAQFNQVRFQDPALKASGKNVFISPSEICAMYMTPLNASWTSMKSSWHDYRQTGDNLREKIYATVYPKLTTKSNTYTVHFRAQSLKRAPGSAVGTWTESKDAMLGEYRGSTTIERFIDPAANIPDYAANSTTRSDTLDNYYKWRVVGNSQFSP